MMQTEPNFNRPVTGQASGHNQGQPAVAGPELTRTRCPGCQKLFAVETETLNAMARAGVVHAEFTCTAPLCHTAFAIELPLSASHSSLTIVPSIRLEPAARHAAADPSTSANPAISAEMQGLSEPIAELPDVEPEVRGRFEPEVREIDTEVRTKATIETPIRKPAMQTRKNAAIAERECPRCGAMNATGLNECVRCGIVFDRYAVVSEAQVEEELALGGTRDLAALWDKVVEDYEDRIRHDRFVNACRDSGALSYASKKYSQILVAAPHDDIARLMRNRIVAMISTKAESSKLPIRLSFRIPKLNSIALFGGSFLFFWGLMMPQLKNVMEIGLSLVLLSIGVRLALRSRI